MSEQKKEQRPSMTDQVMVKNCVKPHKGHREPSALKDNESLIPGIPMLECPRGLSNPKSEWNMIMFIERMQQHIETEFGDKSEIFRTQKYPVYEMPEYDPADY